MLVDDAVDLRIDLATKRWNLVTWNIAQTKPQLFRRNLSTEYQFQQMSYYLIQSNILFDMTSSLSKQLLLELNHIQNDGHLLPTVLDRFVGSVMTWCS